jgi:hypothetical protein
LSSKRRSLLPDEASEILDANRVAFEAHTAVADQFADDRDGLAGARQRLPVRDAMLGFDLHLVA